MWSKAFAYARQLLNFAADVRSNDPCGKVVMNAYSRSASGYGTGFNNTASTTEKIAVFAPIPSARVRTATVVKPGDFRKLRRPYRRSWSRASIETSAPVRIRAAHPLSYNVSDVHAGRRDFPPTPDRPINRSMIKHLLERAGWRMPVEDSYIAATARRHGLTIVTGNEQDFRRPGLKVFNPFKELPHS
jgi:hypothetical protein